MDTINTICKATNFNILGLVFLQREYPICITVSFVF